MLYDELIAGHGGHTGTVGSKRDKSNPRCSPLVGICQGDRVFTEL